MISPFPAGSASDTVGRVVLDKVSQLLGQPMVIETKPGAGGIVGFADVAKADPDGYTLVTSSTSMGTGLVLHQHLPYDPDKDFVSVAMFGVQPNVLVASKESGFKTVADLVAAAKAKPGTLTFASAGVGSSSHMAGEKLRLAAKIDVRHVPFRDNGLTEVMAGPHRFLFHSAGGGGVGARQRQAHRARGEFAEARRRCCPTCRRSSKPAIRPPSSISGSDCRRRRTRPRDIVDKLHDATEKALHDPADRGEIGASSASSRSR